MLQWPSRPGPAHRPRPYFSLLHPILRDSQFARRHGLTTTAVTRPSGVGLAKRTTRSGDRAGVRLSKRTSRIPGGQPYTGEHPGHSNLAIFTDRSQPFHLSESIRIGPTGFVPAGFCMIPGFSPHAHAASPVHSTSRAHRRRPGRASSPGGRPSQISVTTSYLCRLAHF